MNTIDIVKKIGSVLINFEHKLGYGVSMGGYAVSAYSGLLNLDRCLLMSPISSLNNQVAPFENRFNLARDTLNWTSDYFDGSVSEAPKLIIYDPQLVQDKLHAVRFKNANLIKVRNVGHEIAKHLLELEVLKEIFESFLNHNDVENETIKKIKENKKKHKPWLNNILKKNSNNETRKRVIKSRINKLTY